MSETLNEFLHAAARDLGAVSESARLDVEVLCAMVLGRSRAWLIAHGEEPLDPAARAACLALLARRAAGTPVAYLTGRREFWSLEFEVSPATLIPRPETETLVEAALERLRPLAQPRLLDLGTGSGALAVALGHERPDARVTAVERDPAALAVAERNALRHGVVLEALRGDWFGPVAGRRFDLIVANPPYLAADDPHLLTGDVRAEPRTALVAGAEGLADLAHLAARAPEHLAPGGWLLVEHGAEQGPAVRALLEQAGLMAVTTLSDAAGRPRVSAGRMAAPRGVAPDLPAAQR